MNDWDVEDILAYLDENAGRYSLEALRGQLLQNGYAPAIVDWAFQVYQEKRAEVPEPHTGRKIMLVMATNAALIVLAIGVSLGTSRGEALSAFRAGLLLIGGGELLGGLLMCFAQETRSWGLGLLFGCLFSVVLTPLLVFGWCLLGGVGY